jgi:hypothetical protein
VEEACRKVALQESQAVADDIRDDTMDDATLHA